jgi:selenocysteine lyase/cysteine desulfurase
VERHCKKHLFSLGDVHYLNGAYMSPLSLKVEEEGIAGMRRKRIPTNLRMEHFFDHRTQVRQRFARLINAASPEQVAILPSVSYGMAIVAQNTELHAGQNVVITGAQMPSNVYVWHRLCRERGLELRVAPQPKAMRSRGALWNEAILDRIDKGTALVSLGHIHWMDGTRFDLAAIGDAVHAGGGALVVDGTQSLGALPFDCKVIKPDAVIAATYKTLFGPYGMALGYFGDRYLSGVPLEENWINRVHSDEFARLTDYREEYRPAALRFDVGQSSNFILTPMIAAALDQLLEWEVETIAAYCAHLTRRISAEAREMGFETIDEGQRGVHYVGLEIPGGADPAAIQAAFAARNVALSVRGDFLRVTANIYNDQQDIDAFLDVLRGLRRRI